MMATRPLSRFRDNRPESDSLRVDRPPFHRQPPIALTVAGLDCSSGAGLTADLRTFEREGTYGVSVATAVVAQSPGHLNAIQQVSRPLIEAQMAEVEHYPLDAAKTGMLATRETASLVAEWFRERNSLALVVDPVLRATAGDTPLIEATSVQIYKEDLFPRATLVTPNAHEAEILLGISLSSPDDLLDAAIEFHNRFGCNVLIKGGHLKNSPANLVVDAFCERGEGELWESSRLPVGDLHGTGCTLSAAITAGLANGLPLREAVLKARERLRDWMAGHHEWQGTGGYLAALNAIPRREDLE